MTEASLTDLIETTLNIPVFPGSQSIIYPAATLEIIGHPATLMGDGRAKVRESEVVINLWFVDKYERDVNETLLVATLDTLDGISVPDVISSYDTTAKKYRSIISFNYIPREEN